MITWRAQNDLYRNMVDLLGCHDFGGNEIAVAQPLCLIMKRQVRDEPITGPTLSLEKADAQSLLQALWDAGLRPAGNTDRSDEVTALKAHIAFAESVVGAAILLAKAAR
jgi:hypothetical protein